MLRLSFATCAIAAVVASTAAFAATATIQPGVVTNANARLLLGQSFDGRAGFRLSTGPVGLYSPTTGLPIDMTPGTGATWMWEKLDQTSLRYPQGPVNTWLWKTTIGPIASRPLQPYQPYPNRAAFGLDEFMAMAAAQGVSGDNVHMMVNIYGDVYNKNKTQAIQDAADLVSYLNATTGTWATQRANNGHPAPYGVKLFSLGNEPWATGTNPAYPSAGVEYNYLSTTGASAYASDALEFIAAMKAVDPSIGITLAATSPPGSANMAKAVAWNQTLLDTCGDQIYGLVTNLYYDSTIPQLRGVSVMESFLDGLIGQAGTFNATHTNQVHVMVGEHGNAISSGSLGNTDANFAMQWQGAVTMADFLGMLTQKPEVERAHSFIWGNGAETWHPMRLDGYDVNGNPIYTFQAVTGMVDALDDVILANALAVDTTSPATVNGLVPYSINTSAYLSPDGQSLSVVLVNIDTNPAGAQFVDLVGTMGYSLTGGNLLTGTAANADSFMTTALSTSPNQTQFYVPNQSVMTLQFVAVPEPSAAVLAGLAAVASLLWCTVRARVSPWRRSTSGRAMWERDDADQRCLV